MRNDKGVRISKIISTWEIPSRGLEFVTFWKKQIQQIPEEFRDSITIEYSAEEDYDSPPIISVSIVYYRHEDEIEKMGREAKDIRDKKNVEDRDLRELERLKAKYEK